MKYPVLALLCTLLQLFSPVVYAREFLLIVGGLGGDDKYTERFAGAVDALSTTFSRNTGSTDGPRVYTLMPATATREMVLDHLADVARDARVEDTFMLMLLGHGSYDGDDYKFNVAGPDLTGKDLKRALQNIAAGRQLVVIGTSASGVLLKSLEQPGRIVITATKSGGEINAVIFPEHWSDALTTDAADLDRNEIVTADEAFRYTRSQVTAYYEAEGILASEHTRLQGDNAAGLSLVRIGALRDTTGNAVVQILLDQRLELERELAALKQRKLATARNAYYDELEQLMLRMATLQQSIDRETQWAGKDG